MSFLIPLEQNNQSLARRFAARGNLPSTYEQASTASYAAEFEYNPTFMAVKKNVLDEMKQNTSGPTVPKQEANEMGKLFGINFDEFRNEVPAAYAQFIINNKVQDLKRQDAIDRYNGSIAGEVGVFGKGLSAAVIDPLNVATAYVPVTRLGMTAGRFTVGAVEGAVGTAMLEPVVLAGAAAEKREYGLADSMLSIAFGSALGGGLHATTGFIGDKLSKATNKTKSDMLVNALDRALYDEEVDVSAAVRTHDGITPGATESDVINETAKDSINQQIVEELALAKDLGEGRKKLIDMPDGRKVVVNYKLKGSSDEIGIDAVELAEMSSEEFQQRFDSKVFEEFIINEENPVYKDSAGNFAPKVETDGNVDAYKFRDYEGGHTPFKFESNEAIDGYIVQSLASSVDKDIMPDISMNPTETLKAFIDSLGLSGSVQTMRQLFAKLASKGLLDRTIPPSFINSGYENYVFRASPNSDKVIKISRMNDSRLSKGMTRDKVQQAVFTDANHPDNVVSRQYEAITVNGQQGDSVISTIEEFLFAGNEDRMDMVFGKVAGSILKGRQVLHERLAAMGLMYHDDGTRNMGFGLRHGRVTPLILDKGIGLEPFHPDWSEHISRLVNEDNQRVYELLTPDEYAAKFESRSDIMEVDNQINELIEDAEAGLNEADAIAMKEQVAEIQDKFKEPEAQAQILGKAIRDFAACMGKF